jgi:hypothetical protein
MTEGDKAELDTILADPMKFAELPAEIGRIVRSEGATQVFSFMHLRLTENLESARDGVRIDEKRLFKSIMGVCISIACHSDQGVQKENLEGLLKEIFERDYPDLVNFFLLCELSYLDQFLGNFDQRKSLYDAIVEHFGKKFAASPPFLDYFFAWQLVSRIDGLVKESRDGARPKMEVIIVGSVKGGVGKTMTAMAMASYLQKKKNAKVAIVDLDVSGPTMQFNLNVPAVSEALRPKVNGWEWGQGSKWVYPTFLDLISDPLLDSDASKDTLLDKIPLRAFDSGTNPEELSVVLLPDSLTVTGMHVASRYFNTLERVDVLQASRKIFSQLATDHDYAIVDLGPGLFGTNGTMITWIVRNFWTSLVLVSSPRTFDVANSLYEGSWLSAKGYLPWKRNVLQLLNMWPNAKRSVNDVMSIAINGGFRSILDTNLRPSNELSGANWPLSSDFITFWRLRSFLYKIAIDVAEENMPRLQSQINKLRFEIQTLPYSDKMRTISYAGDSSAGAIDFSDLRENAKDWYESLEQILGQWLQ